MWKFGCRQQALARLFHSGITLTGLCFQFGAIHHGDASSRLGNQALFLQFSRRLGHALMAHAQKGKVRNRSHRSEVQSQGWRAGKW